MDLEKGIAYCGLACCVCSENVTCKGCRNDGCKNSDTCRISKCCREKGIEGCHACYEFPCGEEMLHKPRVYGFQRFIQEFGEEKLMMHLEANEQKGIVYHYPNCMLGDYDKFTSYEELKNFILYGESTVNN